jgi:lipopolysaccharide transport system ATP-binding protein
LFFVTRIAIQAEDLSKQYRIGTSSARYETIRERITKVFTTPFHSLKNSKSKTIWALKDVSFTIKRGEVVGVIGRNGAGKSTLLKVLSRITEPTTGRARTYGRVGSLLEVGTGFHPELTGRENVYLNGAILGMKRAEIERKFDEIVAFAEIEKFLDTPVKRYSSGMYVRLAFAVAAHLEPEIMLVDEVLAVGDAAFQKKCLGKMGSIAGGGRTILFVSHNLGIIGQLCKQSLLLDRGRIAKIGPTPDVIHCYLNTSMPEAGFWSNSLKRMTETDITILSASILSEDRDQTGVVRYDEGLILEINYKVLNTIRSWALVFRIIDSVGRVVFTSWDTDWLSHEEQTKLGQYRATCYMPGKILRPGVYSITLEIRVPKIGVVLDQHEQVLSFEISSVGYNMNINRQGVITPSLKWSNEIIE